MKSVAPLVVLVALALCAPLAASADPGGHGRGREGGGGRAEGRYEGGGDRGGDRGGGRWRDREEGGRSDGRQYPDGRQYGRQDGGRWNDGRSAGGPLNAEPPRNRVNSLGEGWREQQDEAREGVRRGQLRPLGGVLSELRRRQPGRQLDAGIEDGPDGRPVYRVRWAAQNGRRIDYIVDARTGAILAEEGR